MSGARLRGAAAPAAVALLAAFGAKAWHASAAPDAFRWLLAPTAALVGALAGVPFEAERGVGYLSRDLALVIAPACAGVNFLVVAFLALALGFAPRIDGRARRWGWLLAAAALAYLGTLVVNAARIALGAALRGAPLPAGLTGDEAHRLLGVVVYLGALWLLVFAVAHAFARRAGAWAVLLPLALYLGVTLLAPLARGGWARPEFWPHARAVALASLALAAVLLAALGVASSRRGGRPKRPPETGPCSGAGNGVMRLRRTRSPAAGGLAQARSAEQTAPARTSEPGCAFRRPARVTDPFGTDG